MEILNEEKLYHGENKYLSDYHKQRSIKKLPINLFRKSLREKRNRNQTKLTRKKKSHKIDITQNKINMLIQTTEDELRSIIQEEGDLLTDVTVDDTPIELLGKIAAEENQATTIYVKRDGLTTLTVLLPQKQPTVANLKRAIESAARVQLQRESRQKQKVAMQPVTNPEQKNNDVGANATTIAGEAPHERRNINESTKSKINHSKSDEEQRLQRLQQQRKAQFASTSLRKPIRNTGELVYSTARNGHHHRPNVSWRYLWRAFALFNIDTNLPLNDEDGRKLLSDFDIKNATNLKFCKREKYYSRKRQ